MEEVLEGLIEREDLEKRKYIERGDMMVKVFNEIEIRFREVTTGKYRIYDIKYLGRRPEKYEEEMSDG